MTKSRNLIAKRHPWTVAEDQLLRETFPDAGTAEIAQRLGLSYHVVTKRAYRLGLTKSELFLASEKSGRLQPGSTIGAEYRLKPCMIPANKGLRRPGYFSGRMQDTQFKKGRQDQNYKPLGATRINTMGYLDRKISHAKGGLAWTAVHRLVWIEANGPIPKGYVIAFKPGRRTAEIEKITLDALEILTPAEVMRRTVLSTPKELRVLIQLRGAVIRQINKRSKSL